MGKKKGVKTEQHGALILPPRYKKGRKGYLIPARKPTSKFTSKTEWQIKVGQVGRECGEKIKGIIKDAGIGVKLDTDNKTSLAQKSRLRRLLYAYCTTKTFGKTTKASNIESEITKLKESLKDKIDAKKVDLSNLVATKPEEYKKIGGPVRRAYLASLKSKK